MDDNDFEVEEVTPLPPEGQQPGEAESFDLEPEGPRSRRKRATQIGLVLAALLAVAVIFRSIIPSASQTPNGQDVSQPTPDLPMVLIESNINFGTVSINGQRQRGKLPMLFEAHNSAYRITIEAPPFASQACAITFFDGAPENGGSCSFASGSFDSITVNGVTAVPGFSIELDFRADNLPQDQQGQVNTLLVQSVSQQQTTTVPAGSYIATNFNTDNTITSQRVTRPLQATAALTPSLHFWQQGGFGCIDYICPTIVGPEEMTLLSDNIWAVGVPVALRWRFTTPDGQVLGDVSFPVAATQSELLTYSRSTGWSVSTQSAAIPFTIPDQLSNLDCQTGTQVIQQQTGAGSFDFGITQGSGIEGCQINLADSSSNDRATCLWRFGVLLAVDDAAHKLLPSLPIAPQAEINAVQP